MDQPRESESPLTEVTPLREVPRPPQHCGQSMKRLSSPSPLGGVSSVWVCRKECGAQIREERQA